MGTNIHENLLDDHEMRALVECLVEYDDRSTTLEAIPRHLEFVHGVSVENVKTNGGSVGSFGGPEIQVAVFPSRLEEEGVVAI